MGQAIKKFDWNRNDIVVSTKVSWTLEILLNTITMAN